MGFKFAIPAEDMIQSFELVFLMVFMAGMIGTINWIVMQYPHAGITLMGVGILLLWLSKQIRKKRDKLIAEKVGVPAVG